MARIFRLWEKKRGDRRTGSPLVGSVGEAVFFGVLFTLGSTSLTFLITLQVFRPNPQVFVAGAGFWVVTLVLVSFVLIGGGGLVLAILHVGASTERRSALAKRAADIDLISEAMASHRDFPCIPRDANLTNSPGIRQKYRLPVTQSMVWQLIAATAFCVVWNAITVVLVTLAIRRFAAGTPDWFLTLFAIPFLAIGIWALYFFVQQWALFAGIGPTTIEISDHPLRPGNSYDLYISQSGRLRFESLEVWLECHEHATFQQGTDVRSEQQLVYREPVFSQQDFQLAPGTTFEHECRLQIPANIMHSFQANHNAVHWKLLVRGEAQRWPAFERGFPVIIYPANNNASRGSDSTGQAGAVS